MAIVYSYPTTPASSLSDGDVLILSKMNEKGRPTKSVTLSSLATYISGNISVIGGPFLPLSAGPTVPLTGDLYLDSTGSGPSAGSNAIVFEGVDDTGAKLISAKIFTVDSQINPSGQDLYFQNANDAGVLGTNLMIDAFGSVGIGTLNPNRTLDVNGSGNFATSLTVGGNTGVGGALTVSGNLNANLNAFVASNLVLTAYKFGVPGTPIYNLAVDNTGGVITVPTSSGGSGFASTIDFLGGGYQVTLYMENITPGSPDFGQAFAQPQAIYFRRQSSIATVQGGMPWNLYYNQYTPALDPGYDTGFGCGSQTMCALMMLEESTADINLLNGGNNRMTAQFTSFSQDLSALNSVRLPLAMRIDNGGASPGNGTIRLTLIEATNSAPNPADDAVCLPSTVSVYFRDTTLTSSKMGRPPFNLLWAGADTRFAQYQNGGAAYTGSLDYVFTGNGAGTITRKYELFFQDEINSNSRCSYLKVTDGRVVFQDLPTADPLSKGVVWNDAGTLKISLG